MLKNLFKILGIVILFAFAIILARYWMAFSATKAIHDYEFFEATEVNPNAIETALNEYFDNDYKKQFEVIGPSRKIGIAFPKFYVWILQTDISGKIIEEGAAEMAIEGIDMIYLTDYRTSTQLRQGDYMIQIFDENIPLFPEDVIWMIDKKLR